MSDLRYPNESRAYRDARDALLEEEQELVDKVKSVAAKRRSLPPGGELKEDYVFRWANDGKGGEDREVLRALRRQAHPADLFIHVRPGLGQSVSVLHLTGRRVRSKLVSSHSERGVCRSRQSPGRSDQRVGQTRGWSQIALLSGSDCSYQADYKCQGDTDDMQWPVMHVFRRRPERSFISGERSCRRTMSTRCGRTGISWISRRRVGLTSILHRRSSGPNSWRRTT